MLGKRYSQTCTSKEIKATRLMKSRKPATVERGPFCTGHTTHILGGYNRQVGWSYVNLHFLHIPFLHIPLLFTYRYMYRMAGYVF